MRADPGVEYKGLTDGQKLIDTILDHDTVGSTRAQVIDIVNKYLERCIEIWYKGELAGYLLIFNFNGQRSLDGYKLIKNHPVGAFKIAMQLVQEYPDLIIAHTDEKTHVNRIAKLMGFKETHRIGRVIGLERKAC